MNAWPIIGALLLLGCRADDGTTLNARVYGATLDAWYASGQPALRDDGDHCGRLDRFQMYAPPTVEAYEALCPSKSWACQRWLLLDHRVRSIYYPAAVMHPRLSAERWAAHGVHELLHAFMYCRDNGRPPDADKAHATPGVWRPDTASIEATAVAELEP